MTDVRNGSFIRLWTAPIVSTYTLQHSSAVDDFTTNRLWTEGNHAMINQNSSEIDWDYEFKYFDVKTMHIYIFWKLPYE